MHARECLIQVLCFYVILWRLIIVCFVHFIFAEDEDFPETSNTLVFPPGSGFQQECAAFPIIDDNITEGAESFTISLSSQSPCINITVDEASVEIIDDDSMLSQDFLFLYYHSFWFRRVCSLSSD